MPAFIAAAGVLASVLSSAQSADAQRRMANAIKDAGKEDLPPAWKAQLNAYAQQSAQTQREFDQTQAQQREVLQLALYAGGGLLAVFVLLKLMG